MADTKGMTYVRMMLDILSKKEIHLSKLLELTEEQERLLKEEEFNEAEFALIIEKKSGNLRKLEEFEPMFIEEPVLCENMEAFPEIAAACNIPIATGERLFSRYDFKRLLTHGGVDIIQPDLSHAGGITEKRRAYFNFFGYVAFAYNCTKNVEK